MRGNKIENILGRWEDKQTLKEYDFYLDSNGQPKTSIKNTVSGVVTTTDLSILYEDKKLDKINLEHLSCDIWEVTPDHIVIASAARVIIKLDRLN